MANRWLNLLVDVLRSATRPSSRGASRPSSTSRRGGAATPARPASAVGYPGDFSGTVRPVYSPRPDGEPDPGEVVWTWVPYEEDHAQGKDRPVLLVGRDGRWLLALQLTSKDHDRDAAQEARYGRLWMDVGTGAWDSRKRPSEVRLNRVIRVDPQAVRREGAVMDRRTFDRVARAMADARR
ncbi:type II toxin-antitoxin system PemK/MazF family toxin [Krasilnikoviella flava]|uniref:PemK-like, MazF-like toxin of type II toxin-antitoxin system n=1 Tax=Krasilnikoviella flava TaxID=526729 RepID=A0A1T5KYF3_9MICO|nr:type II toxin-antitoxin system PemK/MazF family toxin [Krasilnikoviella flava]SKC68228.1 PemK-like, MazF-like toxin of type II toxin-antitoxin system [Krasilnikoviella flava]